jgi:hypothetical protein
MTIPSALSFLPGGLVTLVAVLVMILFVVVYALRTKGDVRAEMSHGKTMFKLEAKERRMDRK